MMKAAEPKASSSSNALQTKSEEQQQPFFQSEKAGEASATNDTAFFSPNGGTGIQRKPFFDKPTIQPKLQIGQPGDKYEREADHMADQVVQRLSEPSAPITGNGQRMLRLTSASLSTSRSARTTNNQQLLQRKPIFESEAEPTIQAKFLAPSAQPQAANLIQPKCEACEQEDQLQKMEEPGEEQQLQMKPIFESATPPPDDGTVQRACADCAVEEEGIQKMTAPAEEESLQAQAESAGTPASMPGLESRLNATKGGGAPLPDNTRSQMEGALGADFSGVRVHNDSSAVQMNKELGAQAFAHGSDVYFNSGKYDPGSREGQRLLAHELTHVVQQNGSAVKQKMQPRRATDDSTAAQEQETDHPAGNTVQKLAAQAGASADSKTTDYTPVSTPVPANHAGEKESEKYRLEEEAGDEPVSTEEMPLQADLSGNPEPPDGEDSDAAPQGDFSLEKTSPAGNYVQKKGAEGVPHNGNVSWVQRQEAADETAPSDHLDEFNSDPRAILERINPGRYCSLNCPATADAFENFVRTGRIEAAHCDHDAELRGTIGYDIRGRLSRPFNITPGETGNASRRDRRLQTFVGLVERQLGSHGDLMVIEAQRTEAQQIGRSGRRLSAYHYFVLVNIRGAIFVVDAYQHVVRPLTAFRDYLNHLNVTNLRYVQGGFEAMPMDLRVRPKLFSATSTDPKEKEADTVAEQVTRMPLAAVADFSNDGLAPSVSPAPIAVQMESDGEMSAELAEELRRSEEEQKAAISESEANKAREEAAQEALQAEQTAQAAAPETLPPPPAPMPEAAKEASEKRIAEPTPQKAERKPDPLTAPEEPLGPAGQQLAEESENACQEAADKSQELADNEQAHDDAAEKTGQAEGAVEHPTEEGQSQSNAEQVGVMEETAEPEADAAEVEAELDQAIEEAVPRSVDEMNKFESGRKGQTVGNKVLAATSSQVGEIKGTYSEIENAPLPAEPEAAVPLPEIEQAPATPALNLGEGAVPDLPPEQTDLSGYEKQADEIYEKEGITPELKAETEKVTDGEIGEANLERQNLNEKVANEPAALQEFANEQQQGVETDLRQEEDQATAAMETKRAQELEGAQKEQQAAKSAMELKREEVTHWINTRYEAAKTFVEDTLKNLEQESLARFDEGQKALSTQFERNVKRRVNAWKADRYSGLFGGVKWLKDKLFGIDDFPEIKEIFASEREAFVQGVDHLIATISQSNNETIQTCKDEIAKANQEIEEYVSQLEPGLQEIGKKTQDETAKKLQDLDNKVEEEKKKLQEALCNKREEAIKAIDQKIEAMKEEMSGLVSKLGNLLLNLAKKFFKWAIEKTGGNADKILGILDKGAAVLKALFTDPIGFFANLGRAVGGGISNFVTNIGTWLKKGLVEWLTGAMGDSGLQMPESFDLKGILSLGLQIAGLTWAGIRARVVKALGAAGEKIVGAAEKGMDIFQRVKEEGVVALWHIVVEQAQTLKDAVITGIKDWAITQIVKKATTKLLSMLNPAGAIIQAILLLYDVVMFFVDNWERIVSFVQSIFDSISNIAGGAIGQAAAFIEKALGKTVPMIISFLAQFLGLGGIGKTIRKIIETVRKPIEKIIGKVVGWLVKGAKKVFGRLTGKDKKAQNDKVEDPKHEAKLKKGLADIDKEEQKYLTGGKITHEEAEKVAKTVKQANPVFKSIKVVDGGDKWNYRYVGSEGEKIGEKKEEGDFPLTEEQKAIILRIPGGEKVVNELKKLVDGKSIKLEQKVMELKVGLDALARGEKVIEFSKDIPKVNGKGILTEIDVLTENEIIEVKTSEKYKLQEKLSGDDMTQFARLMALSKGTIKPIDENGNPIKLPSILAYHFTTERISDKLHTWLTSRGVIVRTGSR
jgi:hypothetical protein